MVDILSAGTEELMTFHSSDSEDDPGPSVIVVAEPEILSDLISEKLHALADDDDCDSLTDTQNYQFSRICKDFLFYKKM
ncbi:hypothetical protein KUTeg_024159 [Tegillarca granosa]|uniref:Uncharacterized protein n=1 Tax=Tegillarca granosa TaxID=220873 RepID=A0ABQ9E2W4_TEGGR|nr:hypothetical protein KUTeg_024159 [Tegillarca granosa]